MSLDDRIRFEDESTTLDFKRQYYSSEKISDLISDVMAMANALTKDDRYIVFGVIHEHGSQKAFEPVVTVPDPSQIEQLLNSNIEPDVHVELGAHTYEGHKLAFLRIYDCNDGPYLMKKDHGLLKKGLGKIRKGTSTFVLSRSDLDQIYEARQTSMDMRQFIKIGWQDNPEDKDQWVQRPLDFMLPSIAAAEKIRSRIKAIEDRNVKQNAMASVDTSPIPIETREGVPILDALLGVPSGATQEARRNLLAEVEKTLQALGPGPMRLNSMGLPIVETLDGLKSELEGVGKAYRKSDEFYRFRERGFGMNLVIQNSGPTFLDDAELRLIFPTRKGFDVAMRFPIKPIRAMPGLVGMDESAQRMQHQMTYPAVKFTDEGIEVRARIGQIKNGIPTAAFGEDLCLSISPDCSTEAIAIKLRLVARGLPTPLDDTLFIHPV